MATWVVLADFGAGNVDITVDCEGLRKTQRLHSGLKACVNTARFRVTTASRAYTFLTTTTDIPVTITKDAAAWFKGLVRRPSLSAQVSAGFDGMDIEVADKTILLNEKIDQSFAWANYKVCDPTNKAASILHQMFYLAGYADGELSLTLVDHVIDYWVVDRNDEATYASLLDALLYEHGWTYDAGNDGVVAMHNLFPTAVAPGALGDVDFDHPLRAQKQPRSYEAVRVEWSPHVTLPEHQVFQDTTGGTGSTPCNIVLGASAYYPLTSTAVIDVYCEYKLEDGYELIYASAAALNLTQTGVATLSFVGGYKRALLKLQAGGAGGTITQLQIVADVVARDKNSRYRKVKYVVAGSEKILTLAAIWVADATWADRLACGLADWYRYAHFSYSGESTSTISLAGIYTLTEAVLGHTPTVRVVERSEDEWGRLSVVMEGMAAYAVSGAEDQNTVASPPLVPASQITEGLTDYLTFAEDQTGYAAGGGTKTPAAPTLTLVPGTRSVELRPSLQANLTGPWHYEAQVTADEITWYALRDDGVDWKGAAAGLTVFNTTTRLHAQIPHDGTADAPTGRTLKYHVRVVHDSGGGTSAWSATGTATEYVIALGDVGSLSIDAAKVVKDALTAAEVNAAQFLRLDPTGLVLYLPLDETAGTVCRDVVSGIEATLHGTITHVPGVSGYALEFGGADTDYLSVAGVAALGYDWSMVHWVDQTVLDSGMPLSLNRPRIRALSDGTIDVGWLDTGAQFRILASAAGVLTTGKHMIVATHTNTGPLTELYYDGALVATTAAYDSESVPSGTWYVGRHVTAGSPFAGIVDEVRLYSRALSAAEVKYLYMNPSGVRQTMIDALLVQTDAILTRHMKAKQATVEKLHVLAQSLINNPTISGSVSGDETDTWGNEDAISIVDDTVSGATAKVMKLTNSGDKAYSTKTFAIDHNRAYRVEVTLKKSADAGAMYFGMGAYSSPPSPDPVEAGTGLSGSLSCERWAVNGTTGARSAVAASNNVYFKYWTSSLPTTYMRVVSYILGNAVDIEDVPLTENADWVCRLPADAKYAVVRLLNWSNAAISRDVYAYNVSVTEVGSGRIIAENVVTRTLVADNVALNTLEGQNMKVGTFTAREMAIGESGGAGVYDNYPALPAGAELFDLRQPDCVSSGGRNPTERTIYYEPGEIEDELANKYDSLATKFAGLGCIGIGRAVTNLVTDPEAIGLWDVNAAAVSDGTTSWRDSLFGQIVSSGAAGYAYRSVTLTGNGLKVVMVTLQKSTAETDTAVILRDVGTADRLVVTVNWTTHAVAASTGTLLYARFYDDYTVVEIAALTTSVTAANPHELRLLPSVAGTGTILATRALVADVPHGVFYAPTSRAEGSLYYPYQQVSPGAIEFWFYNLTAFDSTESNGSAETLNEYLLTIGSPGTNGLTMRIVRAAAAGDRKIEAVFAGGAVTLSWAAHGLTGSAWHHYKVYWTDEGAIGLQVDGVSRDTDTWAGGVIGAGLRIGGRTGYAAANGLFVDFNIWPTADTSVTHAGESYPYVDAAELANVEQSVRINKSGIKLTNAGLIGVDRYGRMSELTAEGLRVLDAAGRVLLDFPTAPIVPDSYPMGRLWHARSSAGYTLVNDATPTLGSWVTGQQAITDGNSIIRGVRLKIHVEGSTAIDDETLLEIIACVRPTGSTWSTVDTVVTPTDHIVIGATASLGSIQLTAILDVPVQEGTHQFDWYVDVTTGSGSRQVVIVQAGVWI